MDAKLLIFIEIRPCRSLEIPLDPRQSWNKFGTGTRQNSRPETTTGSTWLPVFVCSVNRWCPHQESNLDLILRRNLFYPLNYRDTRSASHCSMVGGP